MNKIRGMALCLLLSSYSVAYAQCPSGIPSAGNPLCLPPGAPGSPYGGNSSPLPPAVGPKARWRLTWGAFASDDANAVIGTSTDQFSERAARRKAMAKCASMGGTNCIVTFTYQHQCAVIADPIEEGFHRRYGADAGGPTIEIASEHALKTCSEKNDGRECKIIYSNCTSPVLVYD